MTEQTGFDVLLRQRLFQERIVVEVDLAYRQVVRGPPVGVDLIQLVTTERRILNCRASRFRRRRCSALLTAFLGVRGLRFDCRLEQRRDQSVLRYELLFFISSVLSF